MLQIVFVATANNPKIIRAKLRKKLANKFFLHFKINVQNGKINLLGISSVTLKTNRALMNAKSKKVSR